MNYPLSYILYNAKNHYEIVVYTGRTFCLCHEGLMDYKFSNGNPIAEYHTMVTNIFC